MTETSPLTIKFVGNEITPESVRARDLAAVLAAYERSLVALAQQAHPDFDEEKDFVSLTLVERGSLSLIFTPTRADSLLPAAYELLDKTRGSRWGELPAAALKGLRDVQTFTKRYLCEAYLSVDFAGNAIAAVITPDTAIPADLTIEGQTEIIGRVQRTGGAEPKVCIHTLQGETLYCETSEQLTRELAQLLYETVQLAGVAKWNATTLKIEEFTITSIVGHRPPTAQAIGQIRDQIGYVFDRITDVDAWVQNIRYG